MDDIEILRARVNFNEHFDMERKQTKQQQQQQQQQQRNNLISTTPIASGKHSSLILQTCLEVDYATVFFWQA